MEPNGADGKSPAVTAQVCPSLGHCRKQYSHTAVLPQLLKATVFWISDQTRDVKG